MPHQRARHLEKLIKKTLSYSGITGVFGHRQVGKTTLVSHFSKQYVTLDNPLSLEQANSDPKLFLDRSKKDLFVIDECQLAPPLFPALKEWVRTRPEPGQFLLTGSVRFSSRKSIRESLTGRIIAWELLPMDLSETHQTPLPEKVPQILRAKTLEIPLEKNNKIRRSEMDRALQNGGLPGIFAVRDQAVRAQRFETMINTILERDLRLIVETSLGYSTLRSLLATLALHQTEPLHWARISRDTRISIPTLKRLIMAFESMFLIRIIRTEGSERKSVLFFEDQGEATYLTGNRYSDSSQLLRFLYSELRHQIHYRPELMAEIFQFRNRGGTLVPLCFRSGKSVLGIIPILTENPSPMLFPAARSFLKTYPNSKLLFVHQGNSDVILNERMRCLGFNYLV